MATETESKLTPPFRPRRFSAVAERTMRSISERIFAELLPRRLHGKIVKDSSALPDHAFSSVSTDPASLRPTGTRGRKEPRSMKVYRTESRYYFSSKQLLPAGELVFFSDRLRRYVHPTAGTLLDPYPRLCLLPEDESAAFEEHWQETLSRFS